MTRVVAVCGGVAGLGAVVFLIPAYVVGIPEQATPEGEVGGYYRAASAFLVANGSVPTLHVLLFVVFLAALNALMRRAEWTRSETLNRFVAGAAFAGGLVYVVLSAVGFLFEILYPATLATFDGSLLDEQLGYVGLTMSSWAYHYRQMGIVVLMVACAIVMWSSSAASRIAAVVSALSAVLALGSFAFPVASYVGNLVWMTLVALVLLAGGAFPRLAAPPDATRTA